MFPEEIPTVEALFSIFPYINLYFREDKQHQPRMLRPQWSCRLPPALPGEQPYRCLMPNRKQWSLPAWLKQRLYYRQLFFRKLSSFWYRQLPELGKNQSIIFGYPLRTVFWADQEFPLKGQDSQNLLG